MLYGTQQLDAFPGKRVDGVFGMWYGKGPGVDRAGDALHCGNFIGTSQHGGVLAVAGDDHGAHSSTYPHQTEHVFEGVFIPVLNPASVQDILDLGLAGIALSRFCGLWVALKTTAETAEQAATLIIPSARELRHAGLRAAAARAELRSDACASRPTAPNWNGAWWRSASRRHWPGRAPTGSTAASSAATTRRSASSPSAARMRTRCMRCACSTSRTTRRSRSTRWR